MRSSLVDIIICCLLLLTPLIPYTIGLLVMKQFRSFSNKELLERGVIEYNIEHMKDSNEPKFKFVGQ